MCVCVCGEVWKCESAKVFPVDYKNITLIRNQVLENDSKYCYAAVEYFNKTKN